MTVEIKELVIKATVNNNSTGSVDTKDSSYDKKEIISDCVEQVLKILKREKER